MYSDNNDEFRAFEPYHIVALPTILTRLLLLIHDLIVENIIVILVRRRQIHIMPYIVSIIGVYCFTSITNTTQELLTVLHPCTVKFTHAIMRNFCRIKASRVSGKLSKSHFIFLISCQLGRF